MTEEPIYGFKGEYSWLSNFHKCDVFYDGYTFPSVENAYVYAKIMKCFRTQKLIDTLLTCSASQAKSLGKSNTTQANWDMEKYFIMSSIIFDKFRNKELLQMLLDTGSRHLEETNTWNDRYWGVCDGTGQNKLGIILMKVRTFWSDLESKKTTSLF